MKIWCTQKCRDYRYRQTKGVRCKNSHIASTTYAYVNIQNQTQVNSLCFDICSDKVYVCVYFVQYTLFSWIRSTLVDRTFIMNILSFNIFFPIFHVNTHQHVCSFSAVAWQRISIISCFIFFPFANGISAQALHCSQIRMEK